VYVHSLHRYPPPLTIRVCMYVCTYVCMYVYDTNIHIPPPPRGTSSSLVSLSLVLRTPTLPLPPKKNGQQNILDSGEKGTRDYNRMGERTGGRGVVTRGLRSPEIFPGRNEVTNAPSPRRYPLTRRRGGIVLFGSVRYTPATGAYRLLHTYTHIHTHTEFIRVMRRDGQRARARLDAEIITLRGTKSLVLFQLSSIPAYPVVEAESPSGKARDCRTSRCFQSEIQGFASHPTQDGARTLVNEI